MRKGRSRGVSKEELLRLQHRIAELETGRQNIAAQDNNETTRPLPLRSIEPDGDSTNHANAMMGLMEEESQNPLNHFGDSSAMGFMKQIKSVIDQQITPPGSHPSTIPIKRPAISHRPSIQARNLDYVLPSRQRADHLLETYWRLVDTLYPFLNKEEVVATYRSLWTGEPLGDEGSTFLCLLNVIFSIACILEPSIPPEERVSSADIFYQRARELLDFEVILRQSILTVQCLLLLGQYLQSTNDPQQCWIFVGLAIRIAQGLCLDLPSTSAQAQSLQLRDLLCKVWHGCVLMDRTISMTFGRPAMITSQAAASVPRPMAHQDRSECICSNTIGRVVASSPELHFFIESLKLYELMSETLLALYDPASLEEPNEDPYITYFGSHCTKTLGNVFEMDRKFWLWNRDLPFHLRYDTTMCKSPIHERQTNVLRLRYYHVRVLLFRPVLSRFCSRYNSRETSLDESMPESIALQCSVICVRIALETVKFFDTRMEGHLQEELDDLLPAWWYSIFYIYTAATVLVAARLHPAITAEVTEEAITNAWQAVMKALGRFQSFSKHAKRCMAALQVLFDQVPQQHRYKQLLLQNRSQQLQQLQQQQHQQRQHHGRRQIQGRQRMADAVPAANTDPAMMALGECLVMEDNRSLSEGDDLNNYLIDRSYPTITEAWNLQQDYNVISGPFVTSDLQLDSGDMSWLNSIPFDLID